VLNGVYHPPQIMSIGAILIICEQRARKSKY
jgi:hypothetical protein